MPTYLLSQKKTQPQITEICLSLALLKNTEKEIKKLELACSSIEAYCMSLLVDQVKKKNRQMLLYMPSVLVFHYSP